MTASRAASPPRRAAPAPAALLLLCAAAAAWAAPLAAQVSMGVVARRPDAQGLQIPVNVFGSAVAIEATNHSTRTADPVVTIFSYDDARFTIAFGPLLPGQSAVRQVFVPTQWLSRAELYDRASGVLHGTVGINTTSPALPIAWVGRRGEQPALADVAPLFDERLPVGEPFGASTWYRGYRGSTFPRSSDFATTPGDLIDIYYPEFLPDRWQALTMHAEMLVPADVLRDLRGARREALDGWVAAGGVLCVLDPAGPDWAVEPMLAGFVVTTSRPLAGLASGLDGISRLQAKRATDHLDSLYDQVFGTSGPYMMHRGATGIAARLPFHVAVDARIGSGGAMIIATLYMLVVGPVFVVIFRRRRMVRALYLAVPVASLAVCVALTATFLVAGGTIRRGASTALMMIDQRAGFALLRSHSMVASGLYPLGGFRFSADTMVFPVAEGTNSTMDVTGGVHIRSGYFQALVPFHLEATRIYRTRERVFVQRDGDQLHVYNGLGDDLAEVVVRLGPGRLLVARDVPAGGRAPLAPSAPDPRVDVSAPGARPDFAEFFSQSPREAWTEFRNHYQMVTRGTGEALWENAGYVARLAGAPKMLETGVDREELGTVAAVVGVFADGDLPEDLRDAARAAFDVERERHAAEARAREAAKAVKPPSEPADPFAGETIDPPGPAAEGPFLPAPELPPAAAPTPAP